MLGIEHSKNDTWQELARTIGSAVVETPYVKRLDTSYHYETRGSDGCVRGLAMQLTEKGPEVRIGLILNAEWIGTTDFFEISKSISDVIHDLWEKAQKGGSISVAIDIVDVDYATDKDNSFSLPL